MSNILLVSGHTDLKNSVANKKIIEEIDKRLSNVEIDVLSEVYSDYKINIEEEQKKLVKADIIILQYPLFWYSMPSLLNKWIEETFQYGFAHGSTGDKLKGKKLIVSFTTGASEEIYKKDGRTGYDMKEFITPIKAICKECQIEYSGMVDTYGISYQIRNNEGKELKEKVSNHVDRLVNLINSIK